MTSHLSFDSPSPPTVMQSISSKNTASTCNNQLIKPADPHTDTPIIKPQPNGIVMDDHNIYYVNNAEAMFDNKNYYEPATNMCNGKDRTMSPIINDHSYAESQHYSLTNNSVNSSIENLKHQNHNQDAPTERSGKIYFEDQITQHVDATDEIEYVSKKNLHRNEAQGKIDHPNVRLGSGTCDSSYFNSPANSVSPTNLHYNNDVSRNGNIIIFQYTIFFVSIINLHAPAPLLLWIKTHCPCSVFVLHSKALPNTYIAKF